MKTTELIFRVLNNEASESEILYLRKWLAKDVANTDEYERARLLWQQQQTTIHTSLIVPKFQPIQQRIQRRLRTRKRRTLAILLLAILVTAIACLRLARPHNPDPAYMRFEAATLPQIASMLKERYHIHLHIPPHLQACRFTGMICHDAPLEVISYITTHMGLTCTLTGNDEFVVTGSPCPLTPH